MRGLLGAQQMEKTGADRQGEQVVDYIEDDEFADLAPDLGFIRGADMEQQRIDHFARVFASENSFETAAHSRQRDAHDICVLEGAVVSQAEQLTDFFGGQSCFTKSGAGGGVFGSQQVQGAEAHFVRLKPWLVLQRFQSDPRRMIWVFE